jgi:protoporphyrinogen oxidase
MKRFAVVGGGMLGMMLAYRLRERGHPVTLFEAAPQLGGLASAWSLGDVVWDRHYHVISLSDLTLRGLLREIGIEDELRWKETRTGFYAAGEMHSISNAVEFLRFPPLNLFERLRLGATIYYASLLKDWRPLEQVLVTDWLERISGKGTFRKIWLPLLRAKLGDAYQRTSAAFIWATIARMYAARRSGLKKEMFGYVEGGYARILERFTQVLEEKGVTIECGVRTRRVAPLADGTLEVEYGKQSRSEFDRVVLTVPGPVASSVCPSLNEKECEQLRAIEYVGIVCVSLLLGRPLSPYYVTNIADSWVPFTAVIEASALVDSESFGGRALVYLPKYADARDEIFQQTDEEIERTFVAALCKMHPQVRPDDVLACRISRVPHVFALPTIGYSDALPPTCMSTPGLHVINSAHIVNGTLNVNETLQLAERELSALLRETAILDSAGAA